MSVTPRSRNPTYLIVTGAVVSLLGAVMVFVLVSRPSGIPGPLSSTRPVVVTARAVGVHVQLTSADLELAQYPTDLVPDGAVSSLSQATGRYTVAALPARQPLTGQLLASNPQAAATSGLAIPAGEVAVVIPPSDARNQVAGIVQDGDHVDILARGLPGQSSGQVAVTFTDLPVQVVAGLGATSQQWIVYLPLDRAEQLMYLITNGQYSFVVRARKDAGSAVPAAPVGRDEFNRAFGIR